MTTTGNDTIKFETKSQLAKLLATENITIQHNPGAMTAFFDIKNRLLVLPVWKNISVNLYDMLVVHEVGHAIDTPSDKWLSTITDISMKYHGADSNEDTMGVIKDYLNIVEDARIDKRQKRRYPGSKKDYVVGYAELHKMNFFGIDGKDVNSMSFIDRANIYFKNGTHLNIKFSEDEMVYIDRMSRTETFEDVAALTADLYDFVRTQKKQQKQSQSSENDQKDAKQEKKGDGSSSQNSDNKDNKSEDKKSEKSKSSAQDKDAEEEISAGSDKSSDDADNENESKKKTNYNIVDSNVNSEEGSEGEEDQVAAPKSETENATKDAMKNIVANTGENYVYLNVPEYNIDKIVDDFSVVIPQIEEEMESSIQANYITKQKLVSQYNSWRQSEKDTISFMIKEFEAKKSADMYARQRTAKTGVINMNKIYSYAYNDDIFRRLTVVPHGKNHGFIMLLDWSGSMTENIQKTMRQLMGLVMFCKQVQIPFEVYTFRTPILQDGNLGNQFTKDMSSQSWLNFSNFKMRNILSSRMTTTMLNRAFLALWYLSQNKYSEVDPMNGTPLNQALIVADQLIANFRKKNKVQILSTIVLTDGASDGVHIDHRTHSLKKNVYFLYDRKTRKTYKPKQNYGVPFTEILLRVLKDRTDCNLLGFFIHNGQLPSLSYMIDQKELDRPNVKNDWKEKNFCAVNSVGYDEFYIIKSNMYKDSKDKELKIDSSMTTRAIMNKFMDFSEKKTNTRPVLKKFIEKVASDI